MDISNEAKQWVEENIDWIDTLDISKKVTLSDFNKIVPTSMKSEIREILKCIGIEITQPKRKPSGSLSSDRVNEIRAKLQDLNGIKANWDEVRKRNKNGKTTFYVCYIFDNPSNTSDISESRTLTRLNNSQQLRNDGVVLDFGRHKGQNIAAGIRDRLNKEFPDNTDISMNIGGVGSYQIDVDVFIEF